MADATRTSGRRTVVRALVAFVVVCVLLVLVFRWRRERAMADALARFERATAPLIARGEPLGVFDREAADTTSREAGEALVAAFAALTYDAGGTSSWPEGPWIADVPDVGALDAERRAALTEFVSAHAAFFAAVDAAAAADVIVFPAIRDPSGFLEWAPVHDMVTVAELLRVRACCAATEEERVAALETLLRIGRRWRPRSALEALVAATFVDGAARELASGIAAGRLGPAACARLDELLRPDTVARYGDLVRAERAWLLSAHDELVDLPGVDDDGDASVLDGAGFDREVRFAGLARAFVVESAAEVVELSETLRAIPTDDPSSLPAAVDAATAPLLDEEPSVLPWRRLRDILGRGMAALAAHSPGKLLDIDARVRVARIAVAAEAHRERTGAWPATLDDLADAFGGATPLDPRTGGAFAFEVSDDGALRIGAPAEVEDPDEEAPGIELPAR